MKITLKEIVLASVTLDKLFSCRPKHENVLFRMAQVRKPILEVLQAHDESRLNLLRRYARESHESPGSFTFAKDGLPQKDANTPVVVDIEALNAFRLEYEELLNEDVVVDFQPITLSTLGKLGLEEPLSPDEFIHVAFLFEEGKELCGTED